MVKLSNVLRHIAKIITSDLWEKTLASRLVEQQKKLKQKEFNSAEDCSEIRVEECTKKSEHEVLLSVPGSLATVLENLPLIYDIDAKNLQQAVTNVKDNNQEEKASFKRGHYRHSSYDSAQIQLLYQSRRPTSSSLISTCSPNQSTSSLKSQSLLSSVAMDSIPSSSGSKHCSLSVSFKDDDDVDDDEDEDDEGDDLAAGEGICGQSSHNPSLASLTTVITTTTTTSTTTAITTTSGATADSAIGESLSSKRSSLDRYSELSSGIVIGDNDNVDDNDDDNEYGSGIESEAVADNDNDNAKAQRRRSKKSGRTPLSLLPSISFTKKLFSRSKQQQQQQQSSWRLFGNKQWKSAEATVRSSTKTACNCTTDDLCCSTTGLILEDRPSTLPAKSLTEQRRHEAQYFALIQAAKRKEARRARQRRQLIEMKRKEEDETAAAAQIWCSRILPNWEQMKETKYCRELWWRGIPSKVRGDVWFMVIGNELNITSELYEVCVSRARQRIATATAEQHFNDTTSGTAAGCADIEQSQLDSSICSKGDVKDQIGRENTLELIHLDVSRTFPNLGFFQKGGPYEELLLDLLGAYVCYRPDIGYVQSMCFLGAMLLLQIHQPYQSFQAFANLLNRPLMLAFFGLQQPQMTVYFIAYDQYFEQELPKLHHHFDVLDVRPDLYLIEWLYTLYAKSLPFDVSCRIWDIFLRDGEQFLFSTALGIMHLYESELESMKDFDAIVNFLTHLPQSFKVNKLFDAIEPFMKSSSTSESVNAKRRSFQQIYTDVNERITQAASITRGNGTSTLSAPTDIFHRNSNVSNRGELSSTFATSFRARNSEEEQQQAAAIRSNVCNMKMSKSLSGFLDDLLRGDVPTRDETPAELPKKSTIPTAV